jgi:hypothetical protein
MPFDIGHTDRVATAYDPEDDGSWAERIITAVGVTLAVLVVAATAVLMGMMD